MNQPYNPYQAPQSDLLSNPSQPQGELLFEPNRLSVGSGKDWISQSWRIFSARPWLWIGIMIVMILITFLMGILSAIPVIGFLVNLASIVVNFALLAGIAYVAGAIDYQEEVSFSDVFVGFSSKLIDFTILTLIYLGLMLLVILMIVAMSFVFGFGTNFNFDSQSLQTSMLLLMLFGLLLFIPILMMIYFAPILILFHDVKPFAAMKLSLKGCIRNMLPFLVFTILMILITLISAIPLGLGLLVSIPLYLIGNYFAYKQIFLTQ